MHLSRTRAVVGLAAVGVVAASGVASAAPHHGGWPAPGTPTTPTARALFYRGLLGESTFTQGSAQITVTGRYTHLIPGNSYFTVIYSNGNCDPAQAFPVGPFTADANGNASLNVTLPTAVPVSGTHSMSVRRADTQYDEDGDGKTGPTDVVAVPGQPSIGLVECDATPTVTGVS